MNREMPIEIRRALDHAAKISRDRASTGAQISAALDEISRIAWEVDPEFAVHWDAMRAETLRLHPQIGFGDDGVEL